VGKQSTRCPQRKVYGVTCKADPNKVEGLLGGWSQHIYLQPGVKVIKLPPTLPPKIFIAGGCALPTALHAIQRADIQLGDIVVVQGSGPVGLMIAVMASLRGAFDVILVGAPDHRLEVAKAFGILKTINIQKIGVPERLQQILEWTNGRGADVTIEATGVPGAVKEGLKMTRDGGTYVVVGQYTNAGEVSINPHYEINRKHIVIKGSWGSDFSHFYLGVRFMDKYKDTFPWDKIISREYSLDEISTAWDDVEQLKVLKAIIKP